MQWQWIEPLLARPDPGGAKDKHARRTVLNTILYVLKTGGQWAMLSTAPPRIKPCKIISGEWSRRGVWAKINRLVNEPSRKKGRTATPSYLLIDSKV